MGPGTPGYPDVPGHDIFGGPGILPGYTTLESEDCLSCYARRCMVTWRCFGGNCLRQFASQLNPEKSWLGGSRGRCAPGAQGWGHLVQQQQQEAAHFPHTCFHKNLHSHLLHFISPQGGDCTL